MRHRIDDGLRAPIRFVPTTAIVDTMIRPVKSDSTRTHRRHSDEFKRSLVEQSRQPGASVARIARDNGIISGPTGQQIRSFLWLFTLSGMYISTRRWRRSDTSNADHENQFCGLEYTQLIKDHGIAIYLDGKSCWRDNVFVERLGKSIKHEVLNLGAYDTVSAVCSDIKQ